VDNSKSALVRSWEIGKIMDIVYLLWHVYETSPGEDETKFIGVYRTMEDAQAAIDRLSNQPGFRDMPEGFEVHPHTLNEDGWKEGFLVIVNGYEKENTDVWWEKKNITTYHFRPAPKDYSIFEVFKNGKSLGCEVSVVGKNVPIVTGLTPPDAYNAAVADSFRKKIITE
jgi:predicted SnoaL-like aldol condensation-catalyzing enzyme